MKAGVMVLLLCATGLLHGRGTPKGGTPKDTKIEKESRFCRLDVLRSYLLKGRHVPSEDDPLWVCPSVTQNCCTKADQQRMYHIVNDMLPPKILNYEERVKSALSALLKFHKHVVANPPQFVGSPARRGFCQRQARLLFSFPLSSLLGRLFDLIAASNQDMRVYYRRLFCVLCDGANHSQLVAGKFGGKANFNAAFCQATLHSHEEFISTLNVHLVAYLVNLQNVVDCKHYVRSFNLEFFSRQAVANTVSLVNCLDFVAGKDFLKFCRPTCARLNLARVTTLLQGDLDFLLDALNLFRRSFEVRESGNFVSPRTRFFFKTRVTEVLESTTQDTRKLSASARTDSLGAKFRKLSRKQLQKAADLFRELAKRDATQQLAAIASKRLHATSPANRVKETAPHTDSGMDTGRVLAEALKPPAAAASASPAAQKPEEKKQRNSIPKLQLSGPPQESYGLIHIERRKGRTAYVYHVQPPPIDFDNLTKVYQSSGGINPELYNNNAFDMPRRLFYLRLYGDTHKESPDHALEFLLADFTDQSLEAVHKELEASFRIDPDNWVSLERSVLRLPS